MSWLWNFTTSLLADNAFRRVFIDALLTCITLFPLVNFFFIGWKRREQEIETGLPARAKYLYLSVYQQIECTEENASDILREMYRKWYGRSLYVVPILLVFIVSIYQNFYLADAIKTLVTADRSHQDTALTVSDAAIAGAYTFVTFDFFARMQRRNLAIIDVLGGALRMIMALPIGYAFEAVDKSHGAALAFIVTALPVEFLATMARRLANKWLKLEIGADTSLDQVKTLAGVDAPIADRISSADITTITQLAWCDPIQLTMRTNLQFNFILDLVSQALAWVYFEKRLERLRPLGLRGAVEIRNLLLALSYSSGRARTKAASVLPAAAEAAAILTPPATQGGRQYPQNRLNDKLSRAGILHAFEEIAYDPATEFLYEAWEETATMQDSTKRPKAAHTPRRQQRSRAARTRQASRRGSRKKRL
jgi:hypothetical protein